MLGWSHICSARLRLPSWTFRFSHAALPLTLCVWRMCGEPRLAFCWPFKFKIQSVGPQHELRPHRGACANSSSWHTWRYPFLLFCSCLLLLLLLLLTPPSLFVPPPKPAIQAVMLPVPDMEARKRLVRGPS